jgi:flagellar basal body P-ring formation protein FlgA
MKRAGGFFALVLLFGFSAAQAQRALLPSQVPTPSASPSVGNTLPAAKPLGPELARQIEGFVRSHESFDGKRIEITLGMPSAPIQGCPGGPEINFLSRQLPWGQSNVVLSCRKPAWNVSVPVQTAVFGQVFLASRPLSRGESLTQADVRAAELEITSYRQPLATRLTEIEGRVLAGPVRAGEPLALNNLRLEAVIKVRDSVMITVRGAGFEASAEGVALSAGGVGELIKVRMPDGQVVQAQVIRAGLAEVRLD